MSRPKWTIEEVNARLKAGNVGVRVDQVGSRLRLRATLPPKPGSDKDKPYQQQINLGIYANPDGLAEAEAKARELGVMLARGTFSWVGSGLGGSCQDWVERYRVHLLANRKGMTDQVWRQDFYNMGLKWLPPDQPLSPATVATVAQHYPPDSRARQLCLGILRAFCGWAGLEIDLGPYRSSYSAKSVDAIDIPTTDRIVRGRLKSRIVSKKAHTV
jgi:hypothetical protein